MSHWYHQDEQDVWPKLLQCSKESPILTPSMSAVPVYECQSARMSKIKNGGLDQYGKV